MEEVSIKINEHFTLTNRLRWKWRKASVSQGLQEFEKVYEQMWQGSRGTEIWEEVPQATENEKQ